MNAKKLLSLWGLKWNPFSPELPSEALLVTAQVESFAWRLEQLVQEGGFALITGESGTGKSVALRIVALRLARLRDVVVGAVERPQSKTPDFYRELGDIFAVKLSPHNRWGGFKVLRERWKAHLAASRIKPVLLIDEAQEMAPEVLSELRLLTSADFDATSLLTVVFSGDGRLLELLRHEDLVPLGTRIRTRLNTEAASREELAELLRHALSKAGNPSLMTPELMDTLVDHAAGNYRLLMTMGAELLAHGLAREVEQLDEKFYLEVFQPRAAPRTRRVREESEGLKMALPRNSLHEASRRGDRPLPVVRIGEIPDEDNARRWLVEELWGDSSVGVIGGAPKCAKTWLGLDLALSVATGTPCLGRYAVPAPGPVLVYLAEDALPVVRQRVAGMARHRGLDLAAVEIHVITAAALRLDQDPHRTRLFETARRLRPRLLLLDPLVRLHGVDENHATEVAGLLSYFRSLQRRLDLSVVLVHHTRKNATAGAPGQGLRGSGDIHAFGDSNLYLRRSGPRLVLSSEHRAAPAAPPVTLELVATDAESTHLEITAPQQDENRHRLHQQLLTLLAGDGPLSRTRLRDALGVKNERLGEALRSLEQAGRIRRTAAGWQRLD